MLRNPYFLKDFILYAYGTKKSIIVVLTQKEDNHDEHPIFFFSQTLYGAKERYRVIDKYMFTTMKSLNMFKHYISQNTIIVVTIHLDIQSYIMQGDMDSSIARWITKILQYNVEIHPKKVVKGRTLCKQLVED